MCREKSWFGCISKPALQGARMVHDEGRSVLCCGACIDLLLAARSAVFKWSLTRGKGLGVFS